MTTTIQLFPAAGRRPRSLISRMLLGAALASIAGPASALPLISEVFYDAVGSDDGLTFVEIHGAPGTSLDGYVLEGVNGSNGAIGPILALTGVIPADGLFVVADSTSDGTTSVAEADLLLNFDLQNGPDSVVLRLDADVIDAVGYGVFAAGEVFAGEGTPAPDPAAGSSIARRFADIDTDDNALDFVVLDAPTPGHAPVFDVPEPSTALLFGSGLACVGWLRRRAASPGEAR